MFDLIIQTLVHSKSHLILVSQHSSPLRTAADEAEAVGVLLCLFPGLGTVGAAALRFPATTAEPLSGLPGALSACFDEAFSSVMAPR